VHIFSLLCGTRAEKKLGTTNEKHKYAGTQRCVSNVSFNFTNEE